MFLKSGKQKKCPTPKWCQALFFQKGAWHLESYIKIDRDCEGAGFAAAGVVGAVVVGEAGADVAALTEEGDHEGKAAAEAEAIGAIPVEAVFVGVRAVDGDFVAAGVVNADGCH